MQSNRVPSYLTQAILLTLFCCWPFGIVAIVYAARVNAKLEVGDFEGAVIASDNAKKWCWISFGSGIISMLLLILLSSRH
jgi:hypothetical protein